MEECCQVTRYCIPLFHLLPSSRSTPLNSWWWRIMETAPSLSLPKNFLLFSAVKKTGVIFDVYAAYRVVIMTNKWSESFIGSLPGFTKDFIQIWLICLWNWSKRHLLWKMLHPTKIEKIFLFWQFLTQKLFLDESFIFFIKSRKICRCVWRQ